MTNRAQPTRRIDVPEPGWFVIRRRGYPVVGARIYRSLGHLVAEINGVSCEVEKVWTSGERITWEEWKLLDENRPEAADVAVDLKTLKTF